MAVKMKLTFKGACEGAQEYALCKHLQCLINNDDSFQYRVQFILKNTKGGSPLKVVKNAIINCVNVEDDKKVAIFDHDFKDEEFKNAITLAKNKGIRCAYSNISFNLFLILLKKDCYKATTKEDKYEKELKKIYNLNSEDDIKSLNIMENKILPQITLDDVYIAIERAKKINMRTEQTEEKICDDIYYQPYLGVHQFFEYVLTIAKEEEKIEVM